MYTNRLSFATSVVYLTCSAAALAGQTNLQGSHPPSGYKLAWFDEFNNEALDQAKWMYRTDVKVSSSQMPANIKVEKGNLVIYMRKQQDRGMNYTGGGVISKEQFRYGYYEARAKLFGGSGWHESVWAMAGGDGSTTYLPAMRTEIDGLEFNSDVATKAHMGLIVWQGPGKSKHHSCESGVWRSPLGIDATADFHTYGFEWSPKNVKFYLDGDLRCAIEYPPTEGEHDRINFWLTAIGYERNGMKINDSALPGKMLVDFAAFYKGKQSE